VITSWVMPLVTVWPAEYLLGLAVIALAMSIGSPFAVLGWVNVALITYVCTALMAWPHIYRDYNVFGVVIIFWIFKICYSHLIKHLRAFLVSIFLILLITPLVCSFWTQNKYIYMHRNYYGVYKVYLEKDKLFLNHGTTIHGVQFRDKQRQREPLAYYHRATPIGELLSASITAEKIGIIGLGSGGLAAYLRVGQELDYYEIDPDMDYIAQNVFSYIKNAQGKINYIFGDARIKIKEAPLERYDLLIVDAFSGDAIPVHLLTVEAIEEYRKHLKPQGILLFHISNRYLNLAPILFSNANYLNAYACHKDNKEYARWNIFATTWFALSWDKTAQQRLLKEFKWRQYVPGRAGILRPWTDKYSNMLLIIELNNFLNPLKQFKPFYW